MSSYIKEYLPKTHAYISVQQTRERAGHHVFVVDQHVCNLTKSLKEYSARSIKKIDQELFDYLNYLDTPISDL